MRPALILASTSPSRQMLLRGADIDFDAVAPGVDEEAVKQSLFADGASPRAVADALAEAKAVQVSRRRPGALVLGCDQMLSHGHNQTLDKPRSLAEARAHVELLAGKEHQLIGAAVIALDGAPIWRIVDTAKLHMRSLSPAFLDAYVAAEGEALLSTVGAYRLEARGSQLFSRISGDYFTILGLPLLPVLQFLRDRGVIAS